jgi:hypothetical protein
MLEGLDDIPWDRLGHAYGSAADVPAILRSIAAGDADALDELSACIVHQGTIYEATGPAIPFLIQLLDVERDNAVALLEVLEAIACGTSYADVHSAYDPPTQRGSKETRAAIDRELAWVHSAREAVLAGVPAYLRLLTGANERVRAQAARLLAECDVSAEIQGALSDCSVRDPSPLVRASAVFAVEALGLVHDELSAHWQRDADRAPRLAAALVAAGRDGELAEHVAEVIELDGPATLDMWRAWAWWHGDALMFLCERLDRRPALQVRLVAAWMRHQTSEVRLQALYAANRVISRWRPAASALVESLAVCLRDADDEVRTAAALELASIGGAAARVADELWALVQRVPIAEESAASALEALCKLHDERATSQISSMVSPRGRRAVGRSSPSLTGSRSTRSDRGRLHVSIRS